MSDILAPLKNNASYLLTLLYDSFNITNMSRPTGSKNRSKTANAVVVPLRVPPEMQQQIRSLSDKARLSDADIMRLAIERGISAVEKMFVLPGERAA